MIRGSLAGKAARSRLPHPHCPSREGLTGLPGSDWPSREGLETWSNPIRRAQVDRTGRAGPSGRSRPGREIRFMATGGNGDLRARYKTPRMKPVKGGRRIALRATRPAAKPGELILNLENRKTGKEGQVTTGRISTLPPIRSTAERRSPIRRVAESLSIPAGSETGAPGAVSEYARADIESGKQAA